MGQLLMYQVNQFNVHSVRLQNTASIPFKAADLKDDALDAEMKYTRAD